MTPAKDRAATYRAKQKAKVSLMREALEAAEDMHKRGMFNMSSDEIERVHALRRQALEVKP